MVTKTTTMETSSIRSLRYLFGMHFHIQGIPWRLIWRMDDYHPVCCYWDFVFKKDDSVPIELILSYWDLPITDVTARWSEQLADSFINAQQSLHSIDAHIFLSPQKDINWIFANSDREAFNFAPFPQYPSYWFITFNNER